MALTNTGLVEFAKQMLALGDDTLYVYGSFGRTLTESLINQKAVQYAYNFPRKSLYKKIMDSKGTEYAFDCVGLIKAYIWLWLNGKTGYKSSQDVSANGMLAAAKVKGKIATMPMVTGLLVHMPGHIGILVVEDDEVYVIECTPAKAFAKQSHGAGGVCKTKLTDRKWTSWCECPFIDYIDEEPKEKEEKPATVQKAETYKLHTTVKIYIKAKDAKNRKNSKGKYSKGTYYVYNKADGMINITKTKGVPGAWINPADNVVKDLNKVAKDVYNGKYGNNPKRNKKLKAEGYTTAEIKEIQALVNKMCK